MDHSQIQNIVRNEFLGATALYSFVAAYSKHASNEKGPELPELMLVLPMVFHRATLDSIYNMKSQSGILKALSENPKIPIGLQLRLEEYSDLTFHSLNLACASNLITQCSTDTWPQFLPGYKTIPKALNPSVKEYKNIFAGAQRLGCWFSNVELLSLCTYLNVRF